MLRVVMSVSVIRMDENVNTILGVPEELMSLCQIAAVADDEVADIMPPLDIAQIVLTPDRIEADQKYLDEWLANRERLWEKAEELYAQLPEPEPNNLPLWMTEKWALPIQSRWGAGLSGAIMAAEEWLANQ
jgi:hypothetical protein